MDNDIFVKEAKKLVIDYITWVLHQEYDESPYVVWLSKTLNNKALLSTNIPDGRYYEITYNGINREFYFDSYVKEYNRAIPYGD